MLGSDADRRDDVPIFANCRTRLNNRNRGHAYTRFRESASGGRPSLGVNIDGDPELG
jgi:hypothetical protein